MRDRGVIRVAEKPTEGMCVIRAWADHDSVVIRIRTSPDTEHGPSAEGSAVFDDPTEALAAVARFLTRFARSSPAS
jgi:hypothetical protein